MPEKIFFIENNIEKIRLTRGNVSNCLRPFIKQNNCILIDDVINNKHIVNKIKLPSFLPGPKI